MAETEILSDVPMSFPGREANLMQNDTCHSLLLTQEEFTHPMVATLIANGDASVKVFVFLSLQKNLSLQ